ncbi:glycerophosphodiester phosphodiesterase [Robertmurraya yapensis]|uniref:Glycerophosphodiester phosphodiesterase n=1 Tax=Bacillus yapensis TaxID=2492960 RepID=A0A3S0KVC2_9BACI|nr:glycerophosphodiester phosphodiesterase [Bacillus yapensis]RTR35209.1 glycerophosphodiester phosphodiesterase [Bacillus yapensis]TKS97718.1 glycerophosphodiester phosphodiesterase [Bacillus yapensis]
MTLIFAHRGYSAKYPENTMRAFREAEKAGADGIELDVQFSKDGEIVVIHDDKVDRTTNGTGFVKDYTFDELRKLDAGYKHKTLLKKEPIPSIKEVLEWLKTNQLQCNIEIKSSLESYMKIEAPLIGLIREYGLSERIIISSFNHYSIVYCHRIAPEIEIAPLYAEGLFMPWIYSESIKAKGMHPNHKVAPNEIIKAAEEYGIQVRPYTVNKEKDMRRLFEIGCSAFITDDPVKALKIRKQY